MTGASFSLVLMSLLAAGGAAKDRRLKGGLFAATCALLIAGTAGLLG